jgi:hypothetical protein
MGCFRKNVRWPYIIYYFQINIRYDIALVIQFRFIGLQIKVDFFQIVVGAGVDGKDINLL